MHVAARQPARRLTDILVEAGVLTQEQIEAALERQRETGQRIGEALVDLGVVSEEDIGWALARQLGIPFMDVSLEAIDHELIRRFGEKLLHRLQAVPLVRGEGTMSVAVADPTDSEALEEIERLANARLEVGAATVSSIRTALDAVFGHRREIPVPKHTDHAVPHSVLWDRTGTAFLAFHVQQALQVRATELHFVPSEGALIVQHRVNERLVTQAEEPASTIYGLLTRLESLGMPMVDERSKWTKGVFELETETGPVEVEAAMLVEDEGILVVLSLFPRSKLQPLDELGLDAVDLARVRGALGQPEGLAIVTAPPRSGGTATLLGLLEGLERADRRTVYFGRRPRTPMPADTHLVQEGEPLHAEWAAVARSLGADIVVLDGLPESRIGELSEPVGVWVLARVVSFDPFGVLERLGRDPARGSLAERLQFVSSQRSPAAAAPMGTTGERVARIDVLFGTPALREALAAGAPSARYRECFVQDGGARRSTTGG